MDSASAAKVLRVSGCSCYLLTDRRHPWLKIPKYSAQTRTCALSLSRRWESLRLLALRSLLLWKLEAVLAGGCNKSLSRHVHACACVSQHGLRKLGVTNEIWEGHSGGGGVPNLYAWRKPPQVPEPAQRQPRCPAECCDTTKTLPGMLLGAPARRRYPAHLSDKPQTKRCSCWNQGKESRMLKRQAPSCCTPCSRFIAAFLPAPSHNQSIQTISESRANIQPVHEFTNRQTH